VGGADGLDEQGGSGVLEDEPRRAAHNGEALVSPSVTLRLLKHLTESDAVPRGRAKQSPQLSGRALEVVKAIARGRTNQEIAAELFISLSTVKSHLSGIQTKLGVRNRTEIAVWAWENRIVESTSE
jgi:DNA-binding NarL/FixJ family response regulator